MRFSPNEISSGTRRSLARVTPSHWEKNAQNGVRTNLAHRKLTFGFTSFIVSGGGVK